ncbi:MAG: cytochrome oxidase assembly [Sphingobacteriales bacterium]|nr:cytochrome oxidase assembly [Sphingobacteriales bacterium]
MYPLKEKRFIAVNFIAIVTLFLLILAGGIVRSSGSGMGCPDWPKCFDRYIPPTSATELPNNYKEKYISKRIQKNIRFAKTLDFFGYSDLADKIRNDTSILQHEEFNVTKTYVEYINRLIGVVFGFLLIALVVLSVTYYEARKSIFFLSVLNLFLVAFQGWLGSIVVSTNLMSWIVTVHMLLAIAILAVCILTYFQATNLRERNILVRHPSKSIRTLTIFVLIVSLIQITLGTTVREQIDYIANSMHNFNRDEWVSEVGFGFVLHRDLAILVLVLNAALFLMVRKKFELNGWQFKFASFIVILIGLQLITGFMLSYMALPPVAQSIHIVLASLLFGAQYFLLLLLNKNKFYKKRAVKLD